MSAAGILVILQLAASAQPGSCREAELIGLLRAQEHAALGDDAAARAALNVAADSCGLVRVAALALRGWLEARGLAPIGGPVDQQGPVRRTLDELRAIAGDGAWALDVEYAETCIRAALAAAQDERPEMELLLTHARDLSERLLLRDRRAAWPRPFNIVVGELWFEVDRYGDAVTAYERAVRADASPVAVIGLARALARLGRLEEACTVSRRAANAAPALRAAATGELARCQ